MNSRQALRQELLTTWAEWCFIEGGIDKSWFYLLLAYAPPLIGITVETAVK